MLSAVSDSKTHHAILRHGARSSFPGLWEDGDYGLNQAMKTKVDRCTNLIKKNLLCNATAS